ncbi:hypothetical protein V8E53_011853, partial [Lactarius tabidus]
VLTSKTPSYIKYSRVFYLLQERNLPFFRELANLLFSLLDKLLALISSLRATLNLPSLPPLPRHPRPDSHLLFLPFILSFRFRLHVLALVPWLLATPLNLLPTQSPSLPHEHTHALTSAYIVNPSSLIFVDFFYSQQQAQKQSTHRANRASPHARASFLTTHCGLHVTHLLPTLYASPFLKDRGDGERFIPYPAQ